MGGTINQLNKISLQTSKKKKERVVFRRDASAMNSETFAFIDESGFGSIPFLFCLLGLN